MSRSHAGAEHDVPIFAYGSNLWPARLAARVVSARFVGRAQLPGHRLEFHKRGLDGSGKADAHCTERGADVVWGAVFRLHRREMRILDEYESVGVGYDAVWETVQIERQEVRVRLYRARNEAVASELRPFEWYKRFVVDGARRHQLPHEYVAQLAAWPAIADPDQQRHARHMRLLTPVD